MALATFTASVGTVKSDGSVPAAAQPNNPIVAGATVAADIAVLVADGASPTQAHVNTLNTDWAAFYAPENVVTSNVSLVFDTAVVTNMNQLKAALAAIMQQIAGSSLVTP